MARNQHIVLSCFGMEIGRIGFDPDKQVSFFQYNPEYLSSGAYPNLFPYIFKKTKQVQVFSNYNSESFKGLPPMIADSLPDVFGNLIFKAWLETSNREFKSITILEQLAYVGQRGMGALEYKPSKAIRSKDDTINLEEILEVVAKVIDQKEHTSEEKLDTQALLNVFKIGSSAGGARPKILMSRNKETGKIIPGDMEYSDTFYHYLIKLHLPEAEFGYNREVVEYCYYLTAKQAGIDMMPSHLVEDKHFATERFDRQNGEKQHVLTASGIAGWDFKDAEASSYENLFRLANSLNVPHAQLEQLFRRMVFNIVFFNIDDHLKNHAFIYDPKEDRWNLAPAYDITYALNPLINVTKVGRALSLGGKRTDIEVQDVLTLSEAYSIKNPKGIIKSIQEMIPVWKTHAQSHQIPDKVINGIMKDLNVLI